MRACEIFPRLKGLLRRPAWPYQAPAGDEAGAVGKGRS